MRGGYGVQQIPRRVPRNVEIIDHVAAERMDELVWSRTAILLAPSLRESWGMGAVEAMQRGIPVIAHPASGLLESLGHAGCFVDRDDWRRWRSEIRALLADPALYRRRSEASYYRAHALAERSRAQLGAFVDHIEGLVPHV